MTYFQKKSFFIKCCVGWFILTTYSVAFSQDDNQIFTKRILFILDGSGSMNEQWNHESKWDMAVSTLSNLIDSFEQVNKDFQIGIRVLGHQHERTAHRCDDTKLEIPFSSELTFSKVNSALKKIYPKGYTPLAYSLAQSEIDFKDEQTAQNIIILITDGLENCGGNPCEVATKLREKNIFINPYIIGLGIDSLQSQNLECIGKYIDAKNKEVFKQVVKSILTEVAVRTTMTISFVKSDSSAYPNYIPYSLIDKRTGLDVKTFIYSSETKKYKDTIHVNPQFNYELWIHTNPTFRLENFSITKGKHHHYIIPILTGKIQYDHPYKTKKNQYFLHNNDMSRWQWHTGISPLYRLEEKNMQLHYNMLPIQSLDKISNKENSEFNVKTIARGTINIKKGLKYLSSIYSKSWDKIITLGADELYTLDLMVGEYYCLFKSKDASSEHTKYTPFAIQENQISNLLIE